MRDMHALVMWVIIGSRNGLVSATSTNGDLLSIRFWEKSTFQMDKHIETSSLQSGCNIIQVWIRWSQDALSQWPLYCSGLTLIIAWISNHKFHDVIKLKHFPRYWPFVWGTHRSPVNSPHKGQWRGVLMFSLICAWINGWVNTREAGDLKRNRAHYDVIVMCSIKFGMKLPIHS